MTNGVEPVLKRCSKCGEYKNRKEDFQWYTMLKNGRTYRYPRPECKKCAAIRRAAWRDRKRASGELKEINRRHEQRRMEKESNRQRIRRYQRQWHREKRGTALKYVLKKYRHEVMSKSPREFDSISVAAYFDRFLTVDEYTGKSSQAVTTRYRLNGTLMTPTDTHRLQRWRKGNPKMLTESQIDEIATRYELPLWEVVEAGRIAA